MADWNCPEVVNDSGQWASNPCDNGLCWGWQGANWKKAAQREWEIGAKLAHLFTPQEKQAFANATVELNDLIGRTEWSLFAPTNIINSLDWQTNIKKIATVAKAMRCLWFAAAQRQNGQPPPATAIDPNWTASQRDQIQKSWWDSWLPDLSSWRPNLSWPDMPGINVLDKTVGDKVQSWLTSITPWVVGGVVLYFYLTSRGRS